MATNYSLGKREHLKSNLSIQDLLKNGQTITASPLRIYWKTSSISLQKTPVKIAFSVPKRKFKRAVDRNLIKRRMREAYRRNKYILVDSLPDKELNVRLIVLFLSDEFISFDHLDTLMCNLLQKLASNLL